ncbi:MAG: 50S ribosome-binding GTPase [Deltaproteobacteria bacterium]|nr:50S ribosome-binding GTPase [Deltaproteobacteria bacterium]
MTDCKRDNGITNALKELRKDLPELARMLSCRVARTDTWLNILQKKLLPRIQPDFPLTVAICGGGSAGKSTLFNSIIGQRASPAGGRAGMNRRILFALHSHHAARPGFLETLCEPFGTTPGLLSDPQAMLEAGNPMYIPCDAIPQNLVLLDTPDFDTGARGRYTNRELALPALEAADLFVYIFTNANYNNRDNTEFISNMFTDIGKRKCILVYRAYPSFTEQEVFSHAMTVAGNLYGQDGKENILGIYRADESNTVAAEQAFMTLRPARDEDPSFLDNIGRLDPRAVRADLMASILGGLTQKAGQHLTAFKDSQKHLALYLDALGVVQGAAVRESLSRLPMERIMKRFSEIWLSSDPIHIKAMRRIGHLVELPMRWIIQATRKMASPEYGPGNRKRSADNGSELAADLVRAANRLYRLAVDDFLSFSLPQTETIAQNLEASIEMIRSHSTAEPTDSLPGVTYHEKQTVRFTIPIHPAVLPDQDVLRQKSWKTIQDNLYAIKDTVMDITDRMDRDLEEIADRFRREMTLLDRARQTFSAILNIIPATAAVTYILHTGDPAGAAGIKIKLTGLFGLKDLYALVAIPATSGLRKGDLKQLEEILTPLAKTWLEHKLKIVNDLFETEMTGRLIQNVRQTLREADARISRVEKNLACVKEST